MATLDGAVTHALLLEVDVAGRPGKVELATPAGMLTLHPEEGSGRLHGNVVTAAGVRHLALAWGPEHGLEVGGTTDRQRRDRSPPGGLRDRRGGEDRPGRGHRPGSRGRRVDPPLRAPRRRGVARGFAWRTGASHGSSAVDARGVPHLPADAQEWPLELD